MTTILNVVDPFGTRGKIIEGKGFYVSFNPRPAPIFGNAGPETALVKNDKYYILRGEWIDNYLPLVPQGWKKCLSFYNQNKGVYGSRWSTE